MPTMDNGNRVQQPANGVQHSNRGQPSSRSTGGVFTSYMNGAGQAAAGSIWSHNPMTDSLSSRDPKGVSGSSQALQSGVQRSNGIGLSDGSSLWGRWNATENQQSRQNASRSTSPPSLQNASNTSPSFNPNRATNGQSTTFSTSPFVKPFAPASNTLAGFQTTLGGMQGDRANGFHPTLRAFQLGPQGASAYDDVTTSRESLLPPSRHSESEEPLQYGNDASAFVNGFGTHSRQPSRPSLGGPSSSYVHRSSNSRSQSRGLNPNEEEISEQLRAMSFSSMTQGSSPVSRTNGVQASTPASSQLAPWNSTPTNVYSFPNGNLQHSRRESMANSVQQPSPRIYDGTQPTDGWNPTANYEWEALNRMQKLQNHISRPSSQSPFLDPHFTQIPDFSTQFMPQIPQAVPLHFSGYGYASHPLFPPTAQAGLAPRNGRPQDPTVGVRCQELEEYRRSSKSNKKWELKHVFGRVVEFAGDQQGSRFLQEKIPTANSDDKQRVFEEVMYDADQLMTDVFGNYVIQYLFEYGTLLQKKALAAKMKGNVVKLSTQLYGCRCVQQALEYILVEQQCELALELQHDIIRIMKSDNGNHVVQKVLTKLPRDRIDFVYDAVRGRVFELSQQQYACRVIQRMIEEGSPADKAFILTEFHEVAHKLVTDNWGNYVVQAVISRGGPDARAKVIRLCMDQFLAFSKQKVASNVMEQCISYGTDEDRLEMYRLITTTADDGTNLLQVMWKDNFANYVVQKLCHCLTGAEQAALVNESRPYFQARKKPSRPDEKWTAFKELLNKFSVPSSRHGSISSSHGEVNGVVLRSRPTSQADMNSAMPTPGLTTGGNSPRTSSSRGTNDCVAEENDRTLLDVESKLNPSTVVPESAAHSYRGGQ